VSDRLAVVHERGERVLDAAQLARLEGAAHGQVEERHDRNDADRAADEDKEVDHRRRRLRPAGGATSGWGKARTSIDDSRAPSRVAARPPPRRGARSGERARGAARGRVLCATRSRFRGLRLALMRQERRRIRLPTSAGALVSAVAETQGNATRVANRAQRLVSMASLPWHGARSDTRAGLARNGRPAQPPRVSSFARRSDATDAATADCCSHQMRGFGFGRWLLRPVRRGRTAAARLSNTVSRMPAGRSEDLVVRTEFACAFVPRRDTAKSRKEQWEDRQPSCFT
jgi:hypothetical protein